MLVLSRRIQESIWIGKTIQVKILDVIGRKVRLGISSPDDVEVLREELCETVWGAIPIIEQKGVEAS